jgi:hypothetical protein
MSDDIISYAFGFTPPKGKEYFTGKDIKNIGKSGKGPTVRISRAKADDEYLPNIVPESEIFLDISKDFKGVGFRKKFSKGKFVKSNPDIYVDVFGKQRSIKKPKQDTIGKKKFIKTDTYVDYKGRQHNIGKQPIKKDKGGILQVASKLKKASKAHASQAEKLERIAEMKKGGMPARNKRNFRPTKAGAGMTRAGVKAYRRLNPGSKLKTAVTGDVKPGSKAAKRRKSYCARSLGQLKRASAKTRNDPNSRIRQARRRWKC